METKKRMMTNDEYSTMVISGLNFSAFTQESWRDRLSSSEHHSTKIQEYKAQVKAHLASEFLKECDVLILSLYTRRI